jgi:hypothetical protein
MTGGFGRFLRHNTIALIALFFALAGTTFAAANALPRNSVGTKQIKNNAVTSAKIKNNQVTGADVKESSLGTVPSATHATTADSATNATNATNSTNATNATNAANAANAANATTLGGLHANDFGRVGWAHTLYGSATVPEAGQGNGIGNARTVGTVTITPGGAAGSTQFVSLHGKLGLYTNTNYASYCPADDFCGWRPELIDNATGSVLDDAIWRPRANNDANTISVEAVVAAPAQTPTTYSMKIWYEGTFATGSFTKYDFSLVAETSPFGSQGGGILGAERGPTHSSSSHAPTHTR